MNGSLERNLGEREAEGAMTLRTRKIHVKLWTLIMEAHTEADSTHICRWVVNYVEDESKRRNWRASTTRTLLGHFVGVLKRHHLPIEYILKDYMKAIDRKCWTETREQLAYTKDDVSLAMQDLKGRKEIAAAAMLATLWATAARFSDVLRLKSSQMEVTPSSTRVMFLAGKGVAARGQPFTVHTQLGPWWQLVKSHIRKSDDPFSASLAATIRQTLQTVTSRPADLRGLRRGALQQLAKRADEGTLMRFSHHATPATLNVYLRYGWENSHAATVMRKASSTIW